MFPESRKRLIPKESKLFAAGVESNSPFAPAKFPAPTLTKGVKAPTKRNPGAAS